MLNAQDLQTTIQTRFGLAFSVRRQNTSDGVIYQIHPGELPPTIGFSVEVQIGWRSLEAQFIPGSFAAELLESMERSDTQQRVSFRLFANAALQAGTKVAFRINSLPTDPISESWPSAWKSCELKMRRANIHWGENDTRDNEHIRVWTCRFLGLIVALLPVEPIEQIIVGETEGAVIEVLSKRYERSRLNRAACIEIQGTRCVVCGFDFGATYGPIGEGFIHVHHVVSVSSIGPGTVIDPSRDLVPVCPNCHAMLHSTRPPLLPDALRTMVLERVVA
jgi:5-methylcytosine-specific restriction enzyme A